MKHLYQNDDGELVAADSAEEAAIYRDCEIGGYHEPRSEWSQIPDDADVRLGNRDGTHTTKKASEWADVFESPVQVSSPTKNGDNREHEQRR